MAFTRQHYVKVADVLSDAHKQYGEGPSDKGFKAHAAVDHVARRLADVFANDNPRFDYNRFHEAAGTHNR